jgi:hypothetical protein
MHVQLALARLQAAIESWQTAYATSPNLGLRQQVATLQAAVQTLQAQGACSTLERSSPPTAAPPLPVDTQPQQTPSGKLPAPATTLPEPAQLSADTVDHKTYRQRFITCGKAGCHTCTGGPGHGPYWYAYWREGTNVRSTYIGKQRPPP